MSEGTLDLGVGVSGELSISIPRVNPAKDDFVCLTDEILVYRDDIEIWRGRAMTRQYDFYLTGTLTCEGVLSYLYDTYYPPFEFQGSPSEFLEAVLENHNSNVDDEKKIYLGNVTVEDNNDYINRSSIYYDRTLTVLTEKLINDSLGGYFRIRIEDGVKYLDYLESYGVTATQAIKFGSNLLDIAQNVEYSDLATVILPLGAKLEDEDGNETDEYLTIESVNGGSIYYADEAAVEEYGWIVVCNEWEDVTEASNLLTKAKNYLAQVTSAVASFEVSAVDLALLSSENEAFGIGDFILIQSDPHGVNQYVELTEMSIDLLSPENDTYTFGSDTASLTESQRTSDRNVQTALESLQAKFTNLVATVITTDYLNAHYLTADEIQSYYIKTDELQATIAKLGYVTADEIESVIGNFEYLTADSATIKTLNSDVANIIALLSGSIGAGTLQSIHITSDNVVFDEAVINDAAIVSLTADKITSGTIYTDLVTIQSSADDTSLWINGSVIQMSDGSVVRVQLGKDASNTYNFYIWDADGNLMWDALGVTAEGLNDGIIVDKNIANNANINESKIDMQSVAKRLNEDGSITVDYSNVIVNDTTLNYALTTITDNTEAAQTEAKAAQEAADTAQATANAAQAEATQAASDAATAQTTATAAQEAATAAQTTADTAKANAATAQSAADDAQATADAAAEAAANAQTYAEEVQRDAASALSDYAASVTTALDGLQSQIDGQIETWYYDYTPALTNLPASDWTTNDEKESHVGDLFFDKSTGYSYRFFNNNGTYEWTLIQDTDITTALATASTAQDTADSKKRVFTSTPTPPYDVGDLWTDGTDIKTCMTARASGATYVSSDWVVLNDYANQDAVDAAQAAADAAQSAADSAQSAADTAASDAAAAQSTADTAKANAATAQTTANNAATAAATAQSAADAAQAAADEAQAAADAVTSRVTTLETDLTVVQGQISSKVWQTDIDTAVSDLDGEIKTLSDQYTTVNQTVSGLVTQVGDIETTVSDNYESLSSQISTVETTANKISSTVSDLQTTVTNNYSDLSSKISDVEQTASSISLSVSSVQSQIDEMEVGGRNYLLNTRTLEAKALTTTAGSAFVYSTDENDYGVWTVTGTGAYVQLKMLTSIDASNDALAGQEFVVSADIKCDNIVEHPDYYQFTFAIFGYNNGSSSSTRVYYDGSQFSNNQTVYTFNMDDYVDNEWFRIEGKGIGLAKSALIQATTTEYDNYVYGVELYSNNNNSTGTISIRKPKLGIGTIATDWTPAPEDMATQESVDTAVTEMSSKIEMLANSISLSVTGGLGDTASIVLSVNGEENASESLDLTGVRSAFAKETSAITISAGTVTFNSNTFVVNSDNFSVTASGVITATSGTIGGWTIGAKSLYSGTNSATSTTAGTFLGTSSIRNVGSDGSSLTVQYGYLINISHNLTYTGSDSNSYYTASKIWGGVIYLSAENYIGSSSSPIGLVSIDPQNLRMYYGSSTPWLNAVSASKQLTVKNIIATQINADILYADSMNPYWIEMSWSTPFIDFHYNYASDDYTQRIISNSSGGNLVASPGISSSSDERLKNNIVDLPEIYTNLFDAIRLREYRLNKGDGLRIGIIAQEVANAESGLGINESVIVQGTGETLETGEVDYYSVDYNALLIMACAKIKQLESRISAIEAVA